jgi:hypothetical protein
MDESIPHVGNQRSWYRCLDTLPAIRQIPPCLTNDFETTAYGQESPAILLQLLNGKYAEKLDSLLGVSDHVSPQAGISGIKLHGRSGRPKGHGGSLAATKAGATSEPPIDPLEHSTRKFPRSAGMQHAVSLRAQIHAW